MILSVVIVSYQVKFFLEQCLYSLNKAIEGSSLTRGQTEVFIVDNASRDGSVAFLRPLFPVFHFIQNQENLGFAKANNLALSQCTGEFILFLNPDTILAEDSLDICLEFYRSMPDAGALGVHMIDGAGLYLRESKRGFPSPVASFFKMAGLARLFPHSSVFSAYYMGHLHESTSHAVDVLSGAFMMVRKIVLDKTGGFDEQFFMYAEDIDLSFRISQTGFRNYYTPGTSIIHFKGESTQKDFRYVKMFYQAMELFMRKHFHHARPSMQLFLLALGLKLHQLLAYIRLPLKVTEKKSAPVRIFVKGAPADQQKWIVNLEKKKNQVLSTETGADEIIFCEGPDNSWKEIIAQIAENKNHYLYKFHGSGTHAAVGSDSRREQGEVFEI